jgi:hypothetical protein
MPRAKAETTKHLKIAKKHPKGKASPPKAVEPRTKGRGPGTKATAAAAAVEEKRVPSVPVDAGRADEPTGVPEQGAPSAKSKEAARKAPRLKRSFEFTGADLGDDDYAAKLAKYRKLSPQRAAIVEIVAEHAAATKRRVFSAGELSELVRTPASEKRIVSSANQDRWRLFNWHLPFMTKDGFLRESRG